MKSTTKLSLFLQVLLFLFISEQASSQCTNCQGSTSSASKASSALGDRTKASGFASFSSGSNVIASGEYSSSIGSHSQADGDHSITLGSNIISAAKGTMTIGHGYSDDSRDKLTNLKQNSLMIGFNSIYPTLYVSPAESRIQTGKVGIGNITEPGAKLHIRADPDEKADLFIEQLNFREAELLLGNAHHGLRCTNNQGMIFKTGKNYVFNDGNVGIGIMYPYHKLEVNGRTVTRNLTIFDRELYTGDIEGWILRTDSRGNAVWSDPALISDQDWTIREDNLYRLEGKVGLGTSDPVAQLDLADIYEAGGINLKVGNDAYLCDVDLGHTLGILSLQDPQQGGIKLGGNGPLIHGMEKKMGIGTRTPFTNLHINGNLTYDGTTGICISNTNSINWFIGMNGNQKHVRDLLIGSYDKLSVGYSSFLVIKENGNIGIGTEDTYSYKLAVNGAILTEEVTVNVSENWPDFVFAEDYDLLAIHQLEDFIEQHGRLPDIPADTEIYKEGLRVGEMERLLLKKVEELTLYIIQQETRINALEGIIDEVNN